MGERADVRVHPTAEVSPAAVIGPGTSIWNQAQVREDARIGAECVIGKNVYVDAGVVIGDRVKVQNNAPLPWVYRGRRRLRRPRTWLHDDRAARGQRTALETDATGGFADLVRPGRLGANARPPCNTSVAGR